VFNINLYKHPVGLETIKDSRGSWRTQQAGAPPGMSHPSRVEMCSIGAGGEMVRFVVPSVQCDEEWADVFPRDQRGRCVEAHRAFD
jgi:hypothetical protein